MSRENVEAVQKAWDAWQGGDMDALFEFYDPEIEWDMTRYDNPGLSVVYKGHDGVREFFGEWLSTFDAYWARIDEFVDAGDCVLTLVVQGATGKDSGIQVEMAPFVQLYRMRDGRAVRVEVFKDIDEGYRAAGLER